MPLAISLAEGPRCDLDELGRLLPRGNATRKGYFTALANSGGTFTEFGLTNPARLAHFIGQGLIETGWFNMTTESLNYSAEGLIATFSKYRDNPELAHQHARKEELIANTVYGGRMDNTEPGDGYKYRGRGFIQLTGRRNYTKYAALSGYDLVGDPDILARDLAASVRVAAAFWHHNGLNDYADRKETRAVSRGVNYGNPAASTAAVHEEDRVQWTNTVLGLLQFSGSPGSPVTPSAEPAMPPRDLGALPYGLGSRGEGVRAVQQMLIDLKYAVGVADGVYGKLTQRAVLAFQKEQDLPPTGEVDELTKALLEEVHAADRDPPLEGTRETASAGDVKRQGSKSVGMSEGAGMAGGAVVAAGAAGAANETGALDPVKKAVTGEEGASGSDTAPDTGPDTGADPAASDNETGTTSVPPPATAWGDAPTDWVTVAIFLALIVLGLFVIYQAARLVKRRVAAHRQGKQVNI